MVVLWMAGHNGSYDYEWDYEYDYSSSGSWTDDEYSWLINTGIAKGAVNSTIDTGKGDDSISINTTASSSATGLENSELSTGDGDDSVEVTAEAEDNATAVTDSQVSTIALVMTPLKPQPQQM